MLLAFQFVYSLSSKSSKDEKERVTGTSAAEDETPTGRPQKTGMHAYANLDDEVELHQVGSNSERV